MRKKSIFIFLITMIVFTFIFSACSGKLKKLSVVSLASGKEYTLPLKAENILLGGNFITFELEKSVAEIAETLKQNGYDCTAFNDNFILIKNKIDENKIDYLVIGKLSGQNRYQFMSAVVMDNIRFRQNQRRECGSKLYKHLRNSRFDFDSNKTFRFRSQRNKRRSGTVHYDYFRREDILRVV